MVKRPTEFHDEFGRIWRMHGDYGVSVSESGVMVKGTLRMDDCCAEKGTQQKARRRGFEFNRGVAREERTQPKNLWEREKAKIERGEAVWRRTRKRSWEGK